MGVVGEEELLCRTAFACERGWKSNKNRAAAKRGRL